MQAEAARAFGQPVIIGKAIFEGIEAANFGKRRATQCQRRAKNILVSRDKIVAGVAMILRPELFERVQSIWSTWCMRSASALEAFRKLYGYSIRVNRVVEMLLFDPNFPRSARFSAERLAAAIERVAAHGTSHLSHQLVSDSLLALLRTSSASLAITEGLHEFLLKVEQECSNISNSLYGEYMALS